MAYRTEESGVGKMTQITLYKWTDYKGVIGQNKGFSLTGNVGFDFVGDVEKGQYLLPSGFEVAESNAGTIEIYAPNGTACDIEVSSEQLPLLRYGGDALVLSMVLELVGVAECAEMLDWKKQQVYEYRQRGKFPEPIQTLASGPLWTRKQIEEYRDSRK